MFINFSHSSTVFCVCLAAHVIQRISTDVPVIGVTSVDDELFALLARYDNQVAVCSIADYQLLRHLHLPGHVIFRYGDMTSCVHNKRLYISDPSNSCVRRFDLSDKGSAIKRWMTGRHGRWSVQGSPWGLSVTPSSNLLVTCWIAQKGVELGADDGQCAHNKLIELSADSGQCVREVTLQSDIQYPHHAVQLTTGQLVVCHGDENDDLHRVCVVDVEGKVTCSYGGQRGSDVGQLDSPVHLAVDEQSQFIFVADKKNNRVVMLSPTLQFIRYISKELSGPYRLYFHQTTRRLYVGQQRGGIGLTVLQL